MDAFMRGERSNKSPTCFAKLVEPSYFKNISGNSTTKVLIFGYKR